MTVTLQDLQLHGIKICDGFVFTGLIIVKLDARARWSGNPRFPNSVPVAHYGTQFRAVPN